MNIEILGDGAFSSARITLEPGEDFVSESGAMFRASTNVDIDVTKKSRGKGGILSGIKRLFAGENFFFSTYRTTDGAPGEVGLAPTLQGEVKVVQVNEDTPWLCAGGSYLASDTELAIDTQFQGLKGLFSGEALFFLHVSGRGALLVNAFGRVSEVDVDGELVVDTGHVVAFQESLSYTISKAGSSWLQSYLGGEGLVMRFQGRGKLLVQSHNPKEFGQTLGQRLPPREA